MNHTNSLLKKVLYQKLGNKWYLFSETAEGEVLFSTLPEGVDPRITERELFCVVNEGNAAEAEFAKRKEGRKSRSLGREI